MAKQIKLGSCFKKRTKGFTIYKSIKALIIATLSNSISGQLDDNDIINLDALKDEYNYILNSLGDPIYWNKNDIVYYYNNIIGSDLDDSDVSVNNDGSITIKNV